MQDFQAHLPLNQVVEVRPIDNVVLRGKIVKISITADKVFYGVKLDNGQALHGVDEAIVLATE